jgi:N-acetylglucosaminyl-diphospho-decaprenol L-rhamnosyltransferase
MVDVAVIIVSWNVRDYLADCLRSVHEELDRSGLRGQIWIVDNASTDGTRELLEDLFPSAQLLANQHNPGFGAANNQGMWAAASVNGQGPRYFLILNPDTVVRPGAIGELVACLDAQPEAGLAGARLIYGDGRLQQSAFHFPGLAQLAFEFAPFPARLYESRFNGRYSRRHYRPGGDAFSVDHVLGAAMLVRRNVAEATGGFDETFHMYCEEIDWCWRVRKAGWHIYTVPAAEIVHHGGMSTKQVPAQSIVALWHSRAILYQRHHGRIKLALARWIAQKGLRRKARKALTRDLQQAYLQAADYWQRSRPAKH